MARRCRKLAVPGFVVYVFTLDMATFPIKFIIEMEGPVLAQKRVDFDGVWSDLKEKLGFAQFLS